MINCERVECELVMKLGYETNNNNNNNQTSDNFSMEFWINMLFGLRFDQSIEWTNDWFDLLNDHETRACV